jgi:hypothetical protein
VKSIQQWIRGRHAGKYGMSPVYAQDIKEGTYEIEGSSNSAYFQIAKAELTVKDGQMTAKITIPSMSYLNVYMGTAKEAIAALVGYMDVNSLDKLVIRTGIIIVPSYKFRIVDILVTNFHQPQSTLLLLISAFVGGEWQKIYNYALNNDFRFLSYGDSSLLFCSSKA